MYMKYKREDTTLQPGQYIINTCYAVNTSSVYCQEKGHGRCYRLHALKILGLGALHTTNSDPSHNDESGRLLATPKLQNLFLDSQGYLVTCRKTSVFCVSFWTEFLTCDFPGRRGNTSKISPRSPVMFGCLLSSTSPFFIVFFVVFLFSGQL